MTRGRFGQAIGIALMLGSSMFVLRAQEKPSRQPAQSHSDPQAKSTFESVCSACHGLDGRGGERGPDVAARGEVVRKSDADLLTVLREGRPGKGMPGFAGLGEKRLLALVAYLRELQGADKPQTASGDPARGKELFFGRARCSECHMVAGQGGFFAAELTDFAAKKSLDELRTAIVSPGKDRDPRKGPVTIKLAGGAVLTGMPRNEDNFSLQLQTPDGSFHLVEKADIVSLTRSGNVSMSDHPGRTLSANELNDLVGFLVHSAGSQNARNPRSNAEDGDEE